MRRVAALSAVALTPLCAGCGATSITSGSGRGQVESPAVLALDLSLTRPTGQGPAFRPSAVGNAAVVAGRPVAGLRCDTASGSPYGAHVELFAQNHGVQVPAGIGISQPRRQGAFVLGGRCRYGLSTAGPTGVVLVRTAGRRASPTVGELFALWGEPLSARRLASFSGKVTAFVGGRRWAGDPRMIPLRRHAQIVLEVGPRVAPHSSYLFPSGL